MGERGYDGGLGLAQPASGAQELERAEAMRLVALAMGGWYLPSTRFRRSARLIIWWTKAG
jgi:hypothetical protein